MLSAIIKNNKTDNFKITKRKIVDKIFENKKIVTKQAIEFHPKKLLTFFSIPVFQQKKTT